MPAKNIESVDQSCDVTAQWCKQLVPRCNPRNRQTVARFVLAYEKSATLKEDWRSLWWREHTNCKPMLLFRWTGDVVLEHSLHVGNNSDTRCPWPSVHRKRATKPSMRPAGAGFSARHFWHRSSTVVWWTPDLCRASSFSITLSTSVAVVKHSYYNWNHKIKPCTRNVSPLYFSCLCSGILQALQAI